MDPKVNRFFGYEKKVFDIGKYTKVTLDKSEFDFFPQDNAAFVYAFLHNRMLFLSKEFQHNLIVDM